MFQSGKGELNPQNEAFVYESLPTKGLSSRSSGSATSEWSLPGAAELEVALESMLSARRRLMWSGMLTLFRAVARPDEVLVGIECRRILGGMVYIHA